MMTYEKSIYFIEVVGGEIQQDYRTEYQMDFIAGGSTEDYYNVDGVEYHRVYFEQIEKQYDKNYKADVYDIVPGDRVNVGYTETPAHQTTIESRINQEWQNVRTKRTLLLEESDKESFMTLPDIWSSKSQEYQNDWMAYRQQLRDIPQVYTNPYEVVFPEKPSISA